MIIISRASILKEKCNLANISIMIKKLYFLFILCSIFSAVSSQTYLDDTPARHFDAFLQNVYNKSAVIKNNSIKRIIYLQANQHSGMTRDTMEIREFDKNGEYIRYVFYDGGKKRSQHIYSRSSGTEKSVTQIFSTSSGKFSDTNTEERTKTIKDGNVILQTIKYPKGEGKEFKYYYDGSKLTKREDLFQNKIEIEYQYKYDAKKNLTNYNMTRFNPANNKTILQDVDYTYGAQNNCIGIISKSKYTNVTDDIYSFIYNADYNLVKQDYDVSTGGLNNERHVGEINYIYYNKILQKINQKIDANSNMESIFSYDSNGKISKITCNYKGGNRFEIFTPRSTDGILIYDYSYDKKNNPTKLVITENNQVRNIYETIVEYY